MNGDTVPQGNEAVEVSADAVIRRLSAQLADMHARLAIAEARVEALTSDA